ncbi:MAG TPA: GNAT family N-acetyltransferase [Spirochaetia bacterium]|nr:GNAT family N-acetyltransferase [Spirochaetia bacterium]
MKLSRLSGGDFDEVFAFWRDNNGVGTSHIESREHLDTFLQRNPGLSFKITDRDAIVGTIICGHDGRRGYVHHLAVKNGYSKIEIGRALIDRTLRGLHDIGIRKCHIFIAADNKGSIDFWRSINWDETGDLKIFSHDIEFPAT